MAGCYVGGEGDTVPLSRGPWFWTDVPSHLGCPLSQARAGCHGRCRKGADDGCHRAREARLGTFLSDL